jgi:hypothetical protein
VADRTDPLLVKKKPSRSKHSPRVRAIMREFMREFRKLPRQSQQILYRVLTA